MVNVLIVTAIRCETTSVLKALPGKWEQSASVPFAVWVRKENELTLNLVEAGMGACLVSCAVQWGIHCLKPKIAVLLGCAGSLTDTLEIGTPTYFTTLIDGDSMGSLATTIASPYQGGEKHPALIPVSVATVQRVVDTSEGRESLREQTGADVVDCEGVHFARACSINKVPYHAVKIISDSEMAPLYNHEDRLDEIILAGFQMFNLEEFIARRLD